MSWVVMSWVVMSWVVMVTQRINATNQAGESSPRFL